jgi:hypothetical protein
LLRDIGSIDIVGEGGSADDAIRIAREASPDILLLVEAKIDGALVPYRADRRRPQAAEASAPA